MYDNTLLVRQVWSRNGFVSILLKVLTGGCVSFLVEGLGYLYQAVDKYCGTVILC